MPPKKQALPTQPFPRPTHDWIAKLDCGCVVAIMHDIPGDKDTGRELGQWAKKGYIIDKLPIAEAVAGHRKCWDGCPHETGQLSLGLEEPHVG